MTSVYKCSTKIYVSLDFVFPKMWQNYKDKSLFYRVVQKEKNKTKILHRVHILILEMLKFEKQHMVKT